MKKIILGFVLVFGFFLSLETQAKMFLDYEVSVENFNINIVPKNAIRIPLMSLTIKANENISVSEILLKRSGLSGSEDFGNIWAESSSYRVSLRKKVLNDDTININFLRPVKVYKNTEENFIIYINLNSKGGGRTFKFELKDIIIQDFKDSKNYFKNISENTFGSYKSKYQQNYRRSYKRKYFSRNHFNNKPVKRNFSYKIPQSNNFEKSAIVFEPLGVSNKLNIGRSSEVGKFKLQNTGKKNILLKTIKFKNYGKSDLEKDFRNWKILLNGKIRDVRGRVTKDFIYFNLDDFSLLAGNSIIFRIESELTYARRNHTIQLGIQYPSDIFAEIVGTNFNGKVTLKSKKLKLHELGIGDFDFIQAYNKES